MSFKKGNIPWNKGKKGYKTQPASKDRKKKISDAHKGMKKPWVKKGKNHWNWKGGKHRNKHTSWKYKQWRMTVFLRDNFTCQFCKLRNHIGLGKSVYLEAHHLFSWKNFPRLRYNVNNGITFCQKCHKLANEVQRKYEKRK